MSKELTEFTELANVPFWIDTPWRAARRLEYEMDKLFGGHNREKASQPTLYCPPLDIIATEDSYFVYAELPGLNRNEIKIELINNMLIIRGEKKHSQKEEEESDYLLSERIRGKFLRYLAIPHGTTENDIQAKLENGVLCIQFPKNPDKNKPDVLRITF